jgi:ABC-type cobalt transport system substrate-binding protein
VQTPMRSSGTELPPSPQGIDGVGRRGMPRRRAVVLEGAILLGMLIVAGGIVALRQSDGDDDVARPQTGGNDAPSVELSSTVTDVEAESKPFAVRLSWTAPEGEVESIVYSATERA